jgi:hypothetical protein
VKQAEDFNAASDDDTPRVAARKFMRARRDYTLDDSPSHRIQTSRRNLQRARLVPTEGAARIKQPGNERIAPSAYFAP